MTNTPSVGDKTTQTVTVTEELVNKYASVTGDENPLHLDEDYASETFFGEQIAHGMLAMGFVSAALAEYDGLIVYLSQDIQFKEPISIGAEVTAECEIVEEVESGRYRVKTLVYDTGNEVEYVSGEAVIMIRDSPQTEGEDEVESEAITS